MRKDTPLERLYNGIIKENPTFVMMLGMCPTLAVTTSAKNGIGMGLATMVILTASNLMISLLRKIIPDGVRMPAYIVVVASFVTIVEFLMEGFIPALYSALGIYIPLIVVDPRPSADATRGTTCDALVESIDLAATFVDAAGGDVPDHIIEGRSLVPWLHGQTPDWRSFVISEYDYSATPQCVKLGLEPRDARLFMVFDGRYKMMHAEGGFRPMLFDLLEDPDEFHDLAKADAHSVEIDRLYGLLAQWGRRMSQRVTRSEADIKAMRGGSLRRGILPFMLDGSEVSPELTEKYRGPARQRHLDGDA